MFAVFELYAGSALVGTICYKHFGSNSNRVVLLMLHVVWCCVMIWFHVCPEAYAFLKPVGIDGVAHHPSSLPGECRGRHFEKNRT